MQVSPTVIARSEATKQSNVRSTRIDGLLRCARNDEGNIRARGDTPTPALSARALLVVARKRERGRSEFSAPSPAYAGAQRALVTLSRLRGRVARASARDGWGARAKSFATGWIRCAAVRNDNKIKEDTL
jgi:hypothetical protein